MSTFRVFVIAFLCLLSTYSAVSRRNPIPDDVFGLICSYLSYKDQCRSFRGIDRISNKLFQTLNDNTIKTIMDFKNEMRSLLSTNASITRNGAIFSLHRRMMLNEEHLLQWMDVLKIIATNCSETHNDSIIAHCRLEMALIDPEGDGSRKAMTILKGEDPEYRLPYNLKQFERLSLVRRKLIQYSRCWTFQQFLNYQGTLKKEEQFTLCLIIDYRNLWEYLYTLGVLPHHDHVFDDEAIHLNSTQMCNLRTLIECGLMVVHSRDIEALLRSTVSPYDLWIAKKRMKNMLQLQER